MAIVQVSRITQRKGLSQDLPQPLAGAEFGWATDERRLFIGNGSLADGAPTVGNTEVLTEFSPILEYTTGYTYAGDAAGYTVQTGPTISDSVTQSLQSRLDSFAIITDFGAVGDGVTDCTDAINRALYQLYCVQANPQIRRSLFFPAGVYIVSDTILVPPYAKLYGEGANSSIILFNVQLWAANTAYAEGVLVRSVGGSYYRSITAVPPTGIALSNTSYWDPQTLPEYVMQTADSLQQTGNNIGGGNATTPRNIEISSMAFYTNESSQVTTHNVVLMEKVQQSSFSDVTFAGPLTTSTLTTNLDELAGLTFISTPSLPCKDLSFDNCKFTGLTYGVNTNELTQGVSVTNSWFDTLYQGVVLGSASPVDGGPTGFKILYSTFDNIYAEGIVFDTCSLNVSGCNVFYGVGNHFLDYAFPATSIININADNNVSSGDMFYRTAAQSQTYPRILLTDNTSFATVNSENNIQGSYTRESGQTQVLTDNTANQTIYTFDSNLVRAIQINYTIVRNTSTRTGVYTVVAGTDGAGTGLADDDTGFQNASTGVTFAASESSYTVTIEGSTSSTGDDAILTYSVTHLA